MSSALLPEGCRLLHLGPQKTGTTSIQVAMFAVRQELLEQGVYIPRGSYRRRKAGWALGLYREELRSDLTLWERLVDEVRAVEHARVCVSNEDFARARPVHIERIVDDFGSDDVHIVAVARRYDLYFPSQWQERVKIGVTLGFDDWLRVVLGDDPDHFERWNVWMGHDTAGLVGRWMELVPPERISVVVADESDRSQLSRVFEQLLGISPGLLRTDPQRSNRGLTLAETELVRTLGRAAADRGWDRLEWKAFVTQGVVRHLKEQPTPPAGPTSAGLPEWAHRELEERSQARVEALGQLPIRVIGELDSLRLPSMPANEPTANEPTTSRPTTSEPGSDPTLPVDLAADLLAQVIHEAIEQARG